MQHTPYNRRSRLTEKHIEDLIRIRINGPLVVDFDPTIYVIHWISTGHLHSDVTSVVVHDDGAEENPKQKNKSSLFDVE